MISYCRNYFLSNCSRATIELMACHIGHARHVLYIPGLGIMVNFVSMRSVMCVVFLYCGFIECTFKVTDCYFTNAKHLKVLLGTPDKHKVLVYFAREKNFDW